MTPLVVCLTTLAGCFIGSIVPLINIEILILGAAAVTPASLVLPLILCASIAQMAGKTFLYYAGSGLLNLPKGRFGTRIEATLTKVRAQKRASGVTLFTSAATGLPPFYVLSIASGAMGVDFRQFLMLGFAGRFVRCGAIVLIPQVIKAVIS